MAENFGEEVDRDALITLLKEKSKELKTTESKNKKLEERYVKIFRENKALVKDKESLEKALLAVFDQDTNLFTNIEPGTYDSGMLINTWNQRQEEKLKLFNETLESHKNIKVDLEKKIMDYEKQIEKYTSPKNPEIEKIAQNYKAQITNLENANKKLGKEIKELNESIEEKDKEIERLRNTEYEVDNLKAELLMKDLQLKNVNEDSNIKNKMKENERKNELLRLRHDLENAQEKIRHLEAEKEQLPISKLVETICQSVQTDLAFDPSNPSLTELFEGSLENHCDLQRKSSIKTNDSDRETGQFSTENGYVNQEYLKNVIVKLFCYIEGNNIKEMRMLMHAISIILKMTNEDKEKIENSKTLSIWTNPFSYFKGKAEPNSAGVK